MKRGVWLLCLLVGLLVAGCGEGTPPAVSDPSGISCAPSAPDVLSEPEAISEPMVSAEESSNVGEETSVPQEEPLSVCSGLCFRLPEGWKSDPAPAEELLFFASSAEGDASVSAVYTAPGTMQGLTESLLIEEFRGSLSAAWKDAGATGVEAASVSVSLLDEPHEALSLTASMGGKTVCQLQVYLLRSDGLYTLTVTAGDLAGAKSLLAAFETDA